MHFLNCFASPAKFFTLALLSFHHRSAMCVRREVDGIGSSVIESNISEQSESISPIQASTNDPADKNQTEIDLSHLVSVYCLQCCQVLLAQKAQD